MLILLILKPDISDVHLDRSNVEYDNAAWEEENQHRNHDIQHQIGIAREVKDQASQQTFCHEALHGRLCANNGQHHLVGCVNGGHGLNQEGDEECSREGISIEVVCQGPLHCI